MVPYFQEDFFKKTLPLELLLIFGILSPQKGTANANQSRSMFAAGQDCSQSCVQLPTGTACLCSAHQAFLFMVSSPEPSIESFVKTLESFVKVLGPHFSQGGRKQAHLPDDTTRRSGMGAVSSANTEASSFSISTISSCYLLLRMNNSNTN